MLSGVELQINDSIRKDNKCTNSKSSQWNSKRFTSATVTVALTIEGNLASDEELFFQISRDVSEDDLTADAKQWVSELYY